MAKNAANYSANPGPLPLPQTSICFFIQMNCPWNSCIQPALSMAVVMDVLTWRAVLLATWHWQRGNNEDWSKTRHGCTLGWTRRKCVLWCGVGYELLPIIDSAKSCTLYSSITDRLVSELHREDYHVGIPCIQF